MRRRTDVKIVWASDNIEFVIGEAQARYEERGLERRDVTGVPAAFASDMAGLQAGRLRILAGEPGVGKTTLALRVLCHVAKTVPAVYVTHEPYPWLVPVRAFMVMAAYTDPALPRPEAARRARREFESIAARFGVLHNIDGVDVGTLRSEVRAAMRRHKSQSCLVVVDPLPRDVLQPATAEVLAGLAEMARDLNCAVLVVCQLFADRAAPRASSASQAASDLSFLECFKITSRGHDVVLMAPDGDERRLIAFAKPEVRPGKLWSGGCAPVSWDVEPTTGIGSVFIWGTDGAGWVGRPL
jgi:hypothetical protein